METMMKRFQTVMGWTDEEMQAFAREIVQSATGSDTTKGEITDSCEKKTENMITELIMGMGGVSYHKGYTYIKTSIALMMRDNSQNRTRMPKGVYAEVAVIYGTTSELVGNNIRQEIGNMYYQKCNKTWNHATWKNVFGEERDHKPTNEYFLRRCVDYLERKLKEDSEK